MRSGETMQLVFMMVLPIVVFVKDVVEAIKYDARSDVRIRLRRGVSHNSHWRFDDCTHFEAASIGLRI
jgi:hypothetical protein